MGELVLEADVFVFFFSGHGTVSYGPHYEPDPRPSDETGDEALVFLVPLLAKQTEPSREKVVIVDRTSALVNELRDELVPLNRTWPIRELLDDLLEQWHGRSLSARDGARNGPFRRRLGCTAVVRVGRNDAERCDLGQLAEKRSSKAVVKTL